MLRDVVDSLSKSRMEIDKSKPSLLVELISAPTVSYAAVQNRVPIVQTVRVENNSDVDIKNVDLTISANPPFMLGQRFHFECLLAGEVRTLGVEVLDLKPDHAYFAALNEAELGHVEAKAIATDGTKAHNTNVIEVLAHNEWGGIRGLPELLAAFVQPNSLTIDRILGIASELLKSADNSLSLDGYQSKNRERVWKQVSSVFGILSTQGLQYGPPPASFESTGQKIRSSERILDARISTCLDSAVLMAACFEQAGLNSVIFFKEGHAWVGVWLIDNCFPTPIMDCVQSVRKRVDSGELLMLEATAITQSTRPSMQWARITANAYLEEEATTFTYAVDVKRARQAHIRALKEKTANVAHVPIGEGIISEFKVPTIEDMPPLPPLDPSVLPVTDMDKVDTPQGRLTRWKSKLLDLTLRNKLLNFKSGKAFLKVVCANPSNLEDTLSSAADAEFRLFARPALMQDNDPRSAEMFFREMGMTPVEAHAQTALSNRELIFDVLATEFDTRLTDIYRAGKNILGKLCKTQPTAES